MNNLETRQDSIEGQAANRRWETGEAAVILDPACVWFGGRESKNCAAPGPDWWGLRTTTNSAQWRPLFVWQQCPMRIGVSMLNAIHVLLGYDAELW